MGTTLRNVRRSLLIGLLAVGSPCFGCVGPLNVVETKQRAPVEKRLAVTGAGASLERLTSDPVTETRPTISPDGSTLLFEVRVYESETSDAMKQQTLVAIDPNTRGQRTLYTSTNSLSSEPVWLPDGSSYVYSSNSPGAWSLVRALTASPNAAVNVIASGEIAPEASWPTISPDGKRVAFVTNLRGTYTIAVVGLDGSRFTLLGEGVDPAWSPDGQTLVFRRKVNDFNHLFLLSADTGTGLVQVTSGDFNHYAPSWSPDGRYLVFATDRTANRTEQSAKIRNVYIIQKDGTGLTQVTDGDTLIQAPSWGKDGWLYFASNQSGNFDIWRLKPTGEYSGLASAAPVGSSPPVNSATDTGTKPAKPASGPADTPANGGCAKDTDCKGTRVCEKGACVNPT